MMIRKRQLLIIITVIFSASAFGCSSFYEAPNDKLIFVTNRDRNFEIYGLDVETKIQINLTGNDADDLSPNWSPDGKQIVFVSDRDGNFEIYSMNADGTEQLRLTYNQSSDLSPVWSPDGRYIFFISDRDNVVIDKDKGILKSEIYMVNADGSNPERLTKDMIFYRSVSWSTEIDDLVVCATAPTLSGKYFFDQLYFLQGFKLLPQSMANNCDPAISPDGKRLLYVSDQSGTPNVYTMDLNETNQSALTNDSFYNIDPNWSNDGRRIVFASRRDGNYNIYVMDISGSNIIQLTDNSSDDYMPAWAPSSSQ